MPYAASGSLFWNDSVASNLMSDVYLLATSAAIFAMVTLGLRKLRARRIASLVGIGADQRRVAVYVSHLRLTPVRREQAETSISVPDRQGGYSGPLVAQREVDAFIRLRNFVEGPVAYGPRTVTAAMQREISLNGTTLLMKTATGDEAEPPFGGVVLTLGTGHHNPYSRRILSSTRSFLRFDTDGRPGREGCRTFYINAQRTGRLDDYEPRNGRATDTKKSRELAAIQRIHDPETCSTYLHCCGFDATGTFAAADYLAANWALLLKEFGTAPHQDFLILLVVQGEGLGEERRQGVGGLVTASRMEAHHGLPSRASTARVLRGAAGS